MNRRSSCWTSWGQATLANITTFALANLFSAAAKLPRCMVVVSSLTAAYQGASKALAQAVSNLSQEVRRSAKEITPVALNTGEVFDILRRRLFVVIPGNDVIDKVADEYAKAMNEAERSRMVAKSPEQFAEEIHRCYPFHPRMRDLVALFRNNEQFRQTRGLMRLVSRIVKDVYAEGRPNNVGLIGVQHMDLNDADMRNEVLPLSDLQEAVAKDIADGGQSHAETIDREVGSDAGTQVANAVMCASLMRGFDEGGAEQGAGHRVPGGARPPWRRICDGIRRPRQGRLVLAPRRRRCRLLRPPREHHQAAAVRGGEGAAAAD